MMNRDQLRFLLLEVRLNPEARDHEKLCVLRAGGLEESQVDMVDALSNHASPAMLDGYQAVIIGGTGDFKVSTHRPPWYEPLKQFTLHLLDRGVPTLGLCYGFHIMADAVGGYVADRPDLAEIGTYEVQLTPEGEKDVLFEGTPTRFDSQQGHGDVVMDVPDPFVRLAFSERCHWQGLRHPEKPFYGLQFHPELSREDFMYRMRAYSAAYASTPDEYRRIDALVRETRVQGIVRRFVDGVVMPAVESGAVYQ